VHLHPVGRQWQASGRQLGSDVIEHPARSSMGQLAEKLADLTHDRLLATGARSPLK
jgi:hypothetical protein